VTVAVLGGLGGVAILAWLVRFVRRHRQRYAEAKKAQQDNHKQGSWSKTRRPLRLTAPPHLPAWWLQGLRPLPRPPERRLSILKACRGSSSPAQAASDVGSPLFNHRKHLERLERAVDKVATLEFNLCFVSVDHFKTRGDWLEKVLHAL
jgi:GGDEF domain-containing protein